MSAACTEREADYDLLAGLITDRTVRSGVRPIRAAIERAVEIVDQVDSEALSAVTFFQAAMQFSPSTGIPAAGVDAMENLLAQLLPGTFPQGWEWLEHLDILDVVRIDRVQSFIPFEDYWTLKTPGYVSVGLESSSEDQAQAEMEWQALGIRITPVAHEFKENFLRLPFASANVICTTIQAIGNHTDEQITSAIEIAKRIYHVDTIDPQAKASYMDMVRERSAHLRLSEWWETLPGHFTVTAVGRVLARANAQRLDTKNLLPPID